MKCKICKQKKNGRCVCGYCQDCIRKYTHRTCEKMEIELKKIKLKPKRICKCGHKESEHNLYGIECYKMIHKKVNGFNCHFQCTCRKFEEAKA